MKKISVLFIAFVLFAGLNTLSFAQQDDTTKTSTATGTTTTPAAKHHHGKHARHHAKKKDALKPAENVSTGTTAAPVAK
jgi:hypothetical protein